MQPTKRILLCVVLLASLGTLLPAKATDTYTLFYSDDYKVYFANGHFFYFTCDKADELIKQGNLKQYPWLKGLRPINMGQFIEIRENMGYLQCFRNSRAVAERAERYGSADELMRKHFGK